mgnify:CR=1 FL=1
MRLRSSSKKKGKDDCTSDDINVGMSKKKDFKELGVTYTSLDPSDPSSFGYMQIGTICGTKGTRQSSFDGNFLTSSIGCIN